MNRPTVDPRAINSRFHAVARLLATKQSRRRSLQLVAGAAAGGLLSRGGAETTWAQYRCNDDAIVFSDGFESGGLTRWDTAEGLTVQQSDVYDGDYAARATSNGQPRFARASLGRSYDDLYLRIWFNAEEIPGDEWVYLMKFRTAGDDPILSLAIDDYGRLCYRPDAAHPDDRYVNGKYSDVSVRLGRWHELQAYVLVDG